MAGHGERSAGKGKGSHWLDRQVFVMGIWHPSAVVAHAALRPTLSSCTECPDNLTKRWRMCSLALWMAMTLWQTSLISSFGWHGMGSHGTDILVGSQEGKMNGW